MVKLHIDRGEKNGYPLFMIADHVCFTEGTVMYKSSIVLSSIEAVKKFVTLTNKYNFPINLSTEKYKIDAKSIMGIFSLDLSKPLQIEVDDSDTGGQNPEEFIQQLAQFQRVQVSSKA